MPCSCCAFGDAAERQFTAQKAAAEIRQYRKKGPGPTTRLLRDGLTQTGAVAGNLLDIGGGIGTLSFELLDRGIAAAVIVDAAPAYLNAAKEEAARRGRSSAVQFLEGDFVELSDQIAQVRTVVLDRVVCCYPGYEPLLERAVKHANSAFAYSYPRDRWYVRAVVWIENAVRRLRGNTFRTFVHPVSEMQGIIQAAGLELTRRHTTLAWSADVFVRRPATNSSGTASSADA